VPPESDDHRPADAGTDREEGGAACECCGETVPDACAFCPSCGVALVIEDRPQVLERMDRQLRWNRYTELLSFGVFANPLLGLALVPLMAGFLRSAQDLSTSWPLALPPLCLILALAASRRIRCPACVSGTIWPVQTGSSTALPAARASRRARTRSIACLPAPPRQPRPAPSADSRPEQPTSSAARAAQTAWSRTTSHLRASLRTDAVRPATSNSRLSGRSASAAARSARSAASTVRRRCTPSRPANASGGAHVAAYAEMRSRHGGWP